MRLRQLSRILTVAALTLLCGCGGPDQVADRQVTSEPTRSTADVSSPAGPSIDDPSDAGAVYPVVSVADGDTITVSVDGVNERVRLIGVDAPELRNPPECFGRESADRAAELVTASSVGLLADPSQENRDRYGRLLRYVVLPDGTIMNGVLIREGYAREHTYDGPYRHQQEFRDDQQVAMAAGTGVWSAECQRQSLAITPTAATSPASTQTVPDPNCPIKGNVNGKGDRIYHVPGDESYDGTVITPAKGERWFCSAAEAEAAGWHAAKN